MKKSLSKKIVTVLLASCLVGSSFGSVYGDSAKSSQDVVTEELDQLFGTRVVNGEKTGILYQGYGYGDTTNMSGAGGAQTVNSPTVNYNLMMRNPAMTEMFYNSDIQAGLQDISSEAFSDITGDEYWSAYVPIAVSKDLINGFEDNTFRGADGVTHAQLAVMLSNTGVGIPGDATVKAKLEKDGCPAWSLEAYASMYMSMLTIPNMAGTNADVYNENALRSDVAYAVAMAFFGEDTMPGGKYYQQALAMENVPFSDITGVLTDEEVEAAVGVDGDGMSYIHDTEKSGSGEVYVGHLAAIICLSDKGILLGTPNGESMYSAPVKRGDALILITKAIQVYGQEM